MDFRRVSGEHVKCHSCFNTWPRAEGGLQCPRCDSEFVEILSDSNPPSPDLVPVTDNLQLTRSRSLENMEHDPWHDQDLPDLAAIPNPRSRQPQTYHYETRAPNGNTSFQFSMTSFNGPMQIGGGSFPVDRDNAMLDVNRDFEALVGNIMGVNGRRQRPQRGYPPSPGFNPGPQPAQRQDMNGGLLGMFSSFLGGGNLFRAEPNDMPPGPLALLQHLMNPANAVHGDAVGTQEALDRVISQLMEQHQAGNAPPPASEDAIRALSKKKVDASMLDDKGNAECSICMDNVTVGDSVTNLPCNHWFHDNCITSWLKEHDTCPHCRKSISSPPTQRSSQPTPNIPNTSTNRTRRSSVPGTTTMPGSYPRRSHPTPWIPAQPSSRHQQPDTSTRRWQDPQPEPHEHDYRPQTLGATRPYPPQNPLHEPSQRPRPTQFSTTDRRPSSTHSSTHSRSSRGSGSGSSEAFRPNQQPRYYAPTHASRSREVDPSRSRSRNGSMSQAQQRSRERGGSRGGPGSGSGAAGGGGITGFFRSLGGGG